MSAEQKTQIEKYLMTVESKSIKVLLWLLRQRDQKNQVHTTLDTAALECNVTKVTVNRVFQRLYDTGFMVKVRNGLYQMKNI
jgi:predicted transcriptional regulator